VQTYLGFAEGDGIMEENDTNGVAGEEKDKEV